MTPTPSIFPKYCRTKGGVLPYRWEAYCSTNGRRIAGFPFLRSLEARKARQYKGGDVLPYKLEVYCRTFQTSCSGPKKQPKHKVFGRDIPGTSVTQTSGYPGHKLYASGLFLLFFRQGGAGMSRDLGRDVPDLEKLYARRLWADFSYPSCRGWGFRIIAVNGEIVL